MNKKNGTLNHKEGFMIATEIMPYSRLNALASWFYSADFTFAKTMPECPHWYTLRESWKCEAQFNQAVSDIREYGYEDYYWKSKYTRININGFKYWSMGAPVEETSLINCAKIETLKSCYSSFADTYDGMFEDKKALDENESACSQIDSLEGRILDIGCGTGLLLDHRKIKPQNYVGIDPSKEMLDQFAVKHPKFKFRTTQTDFESFARGVFDVVVSFFGSPNYINPDFLPRIPDLMKKDAKCYLMFFEPGYFPVSCENAWN